MSDRSLPSLYWPQALSFMRWLKDPRVLLAGVLCSRLCWQMLQKIYSLLVLTRNIDSSEKVHSIPKNCQVPSEQKGEGVEFRFYRLVIPGSCDWRTVHLLSNFTWSTGIVYRREETFIPYSSSICSQTPTNVSKANRSNRFRTSLSVQWLISLLRSGFTSTRLLTSWNGCQWWRNSSRVASVRYWSFSNSFAATSKSKRQKNKCIEHFHRPVPVCKLSQRIKFVIRFSK